MGTRMKRPRTSLTLEAKLDIIERLERGQTAASLGRLYNVNESSIRTIKKSAEKIRRSIAHSCSPATKKSLRVRNPLLEKMEMMLVSWMEDQKGKKMIVNTTAIRAKALKLYRELQQEDGCPSATEPFMASKGWFENFKKRQSLYITKLKDESPSDVHSTTSDCSVEVKTECSLQAEQEEEEQEVVRPTDKLTTKRLALFFTLADRLAQEAMDMDPILERSLQFGRNLSSALAVYKDIYREKQRTSKHSTLTQCLKVPKPAVTPRTVLSSSITTAKLLTPQTISCILSGTESPLQKPSSQPLLVTNNMVSSHADYSPLYPSSCSN